MQENKKRIDPENFTLCNDILFKKFFKMPEARNIIIRFLSAITKLPKEEFKNAVIISEELTPNNIKEKKKTTDITVRIDDNKRVIVEMNRNTSTQSLMSKSMYAMSNIVATVKNGENYHDKLIIIINIDEYDTFNTEYPILHFMLRDEYGHIENDLYSSIHLILANMSNHQYNVDKEIERFSNLLNERSLSKMKKINKGDKDYMAGIEKLENFINEDFDEIGLLYDYEERHQQEKKGEYLGGFRKGKEEGREEGKEEGKEEAHKEAAINLYQNGVSKDLICKSLNISEEQLNEYLHS